MSTIVKDTEVASAAPEALSAPAATSATSSESVAKPQPVALEVSVTVNGARTLDGSDKREPFSESTKTVLVFGNGAVIRLQASVAPGQLLFLTNEKTKKEVVCQVVKSKNYRNVSGYVELEFTESVIGFWGMRFPNDRLPSASVPTSAPAASAVVNPAPASGSPAAPVANTPNSAPAKIAPVVAAPPAVAAPPSPNASLADNKPAHPVQPVAASPNLNSAKPDSAPSAPSATVTPIAPFVSKSSGSTSSSASSSVLPSSAVLTLPRAAQPKSPAPTSIHLTPPAPEAPAPASQPPAAPPTAAENSTDALRAENARLQEQLSALLFPDGKKNEATKIPAPANASPALDLKPADAAAKIFDLAHSPASAPVPPKASNDAPVIERIAQPTISPIAQMPAPQPPISNKPASPSKTSSLPLPSLLDSEQVKIPSWLEPLARNAAISAPTEDAAAADVPASTAHGAVFEEPIPDAHWLNRESSHKESSPKENSFEAHVGEDSTPDHATLPDDAQESAANVPAPNFGSRFLMNENAAEGDNAPKSRKLVYVGIAAAVLLAAAGGYWYTHQGALAAPSLATVQTSATQPPASDPAASAARQETLRPSPNNPAATRPGAIVNQIPTPAALNTNMVVTPSHASQPTSGAAVPNGATQPPAVQPVVAPPKHPALGEVRLAAPTVTRSSSGSVADAEPAVALNGSVAPVDTNLGENLAATSGPAAPSVPIPVGGDVKSAQLLKSVPPIYPSFAKTQRISGDVKIDALIDVTGKVTTMKVIGGPTLLHQAAMDALHQWKYQPATLDGKAVPMHLTVTIQFRMQ